MKRPVDVDSAIKADEAFHLALCGATQNKILEKMYWPIEKHAMLRSWKRLKGYIEIIGPAFKGHKRILEAIRKRDAERAMAEMEQHLNLALDTKYR